MSIIPQGNLRKCTNLTALKKIFRVVIHSDTEIRIYPTYSCIPLGFLYDLLSALLAFLQFFQD